MQTPSRLCPVALYVGRRFAQRRTALEYSAEAIAERMACAQQTLHAFENGDNGLDVLWLLKLERLLRFSYRDYKPPVSFFGFLGLTANVQPMLLKTKSAIRRARKNFRHPHTHRNLENALLKLRFTPLRGACGDVL